MWTKIRMKTLVYDWLRCESHQNTSCWLANQIRHAYTSENHACNPFVFFTLINGISSTGGSYAVRFVFSWKYSMLFQHNCYVFVCLLLVLQSCSFRVKTLECCVWSRFKREANTPEVISLGYIACMQAFQRRETSRLHCARIHHVFLSVHRISVCDSNEGPFPCGQNIC